MMDTRRSRPDSGDMSRRVIRAVVEPLAATAFIALWVVAEAGRGPAIPVVVVFGLAIGLSRFLPRTALTLGLAAVLIAGVGSLLAVSNPAAAFLHPITDTDWPLYAAALVVPALIAAGGSRRALRPSLIAAVLSPIGLAALIVVASPGIGWTNGAILRWAGAWPVPVEVQIFVTFAVLLLVIGLALWAAGWVIAGIVRFVRMLLTDPLIRARFNDALKLGPSIEDAPTLTARERDVLLLVSDGKSNAEIAKALFLSEATVKSHLRSILTKLGLKSRTEIVAHAWRTGMVQAI